MADYISRMVDQDDWMLNPAVFKVLDARWSPHTIDRFADMHNHQLPRFNSRYFNLGAEAIDTFTCDRDNENNWWCPPPIFLISRLIRHARATSATGMLVIPCWPSAPFWPLLFPDGLHPAKFMVDAVELQQDEYLFLPGMSSGNLFQGAPNTTVLAVRLSFE